MSSGSVSISISSSASQAVSQPNGRCTDSDHGSSFPSSGRAPHPLGPPGGLRTQRPGRTGAGVLPAHLRVGGSVLTLLKSFDEAAHASGGLPA